MIAWLMSIDFDHVIGAAMCLVPAAWFAIEVTLGPRPDPEDDQW